jgi:hypothetical protein
MSRNWFVLVLLAALVAPPVFAEPAAIDDAASDAATSEEDELASWVKRLDEARARLDAATRRLAQLEGAKGRGAHRRYPRGDAKEKYLEDLEAARKEHADAAQALPELMEEARRAGVPPGVIARYEESEEPADVEEMEEVDEEAADS